jgi:uncharacterized repeat protein (TIGR03803 family)
MTQLLHGERSRCAGWRDAIGLNLSVNVNRNLQLARHLAIWFAMALASSLPAQSQTYSVIHEFTGGADGGQPAAGPTFDKSGNLYGTSFYGGTSYGLVYKASRQGSASSSISWALDPIYSFNNAEGGAYPDYGSITLAPDGSLFGAASTGGLGAGGVIFNLKSQPPCSNGECRWTNSIVHPFGGGSDGIDPTSSVVFDAAGNFYGTTFHGGSSGNGTVYNGVRSGETWTVSVIYNFAGDSDGGNPVAGLILDSAGNLYGTTYDGGANDSGTVFELVQSGSGWTKNTLYDFHDQEDGRNPAGGLVMDRAGDLFGTTVFGGANSGGTVFELTHSGGWSLTTLYSFAGIAGPYNDLVVDAAGNLYGTTYRDGANQAGSVFKLSLSPGNSSNGTLVNGTPSNGTVSNGSLSNGNSTFTSLHDFTGSNDGGMPTGKLSVDASGDLYGTTTSGGSHNQGVLFWIAP